MAISYVNRFSGANIVAPPISVSVTVTGLVNGDFMLAWVTSAYDSSHSPAAPSGWTQIGSFINISAGGQTNNYWYGMYYHYYNTTLNPGPYVWTNCGYPESIIRAYRGVVQTSPIDHSDKGSIGNPTGTQLSSSIPALGATAANNEWYVAGWAVGGQAADGVDRYTVFPADLTNVVAQNTGWGRKDGDKIITVNGTIPGSESVTYSSCNGIMGIGATVFAAAVPAAPTVGGGNPIIVIRGEAWD